MHCGRILLESNRVRGGIRIHSEVPNVEIHAFFAEHLDDRILSSWASSSVGVTFTQPPVMGCEVVATNFASWLILP